ncbi:hypothetical protein PYCC9005_005629 [Savitreella phatthalungensis]
MDLSRQLGFVIVALVGVRAHQKNSLDAGGIAAALFLGWLHALHPSRTLLLLLAFFFLGTAATKYGGEIKHERLTTDVDERERLAKAGTPAGKSLLTKLPTAAPRTAAQVICNAGIASTLLALHLYLYRPTGATSRLALSTRFQDLLIFGVPFQYAASLADTLSSEFGVLEDNWPFLITSFKSVPPGTNGAITLLGLIAAVAGGLAIGILAAITIPADSMYTRIMLLLACTLIGPLGSIIDSVLGATCQQTLYDPSRRKVIEVHGGGRAATPKEKVTKKDAGARVIMGVDLLTNNQVNILSTAIAVATGLAGIAAWVKVFGGSKASL